MYIFHGWPRAALFSIAYSMKPITTNEQDILFSANELASDFYIVTSGKVRYTQLKLHTVVCTTYCSFEFACRMTRMMVVKGNSRSVEVELVGRLGLCGYPEMIEGKKSSRRQESAFCVTSCTLLAVSMNTYLSILAFAFGSRFVCWMYEINNLLF